MFRFGLQALRDVLSSTSRKTVTLSGTLLVVGFAFGANQFLEYSRQRALRTEGARQGIEEQANQDQESKAPFQLGTADPLKSTQEPAPTAEVSAADAPVATGAEDIKNILETGNTGNVEPPGANGFVQNGFSETNPDPVLADRAPADAPSKDSSKEELVAFSGGLVTPFPSPSALPDTYHAGVSNVTNPGVFPVNIGMPGFGFISGGGISHGTTLMMQAQIGEVVSPNLTFTSDLILVSGLTGPLLESF